MPAAAVAMYRPSSVMASTTIVTTRPMKATFALTTSSAPVSGDVSRLSATTASSRPAAPMSGSARRVLSYVETTRGAPAKMRWVRPMKPATNKTTTAMAKQTNAS